MIFLTIRRCSVYESIGEFLKLTITAAHEIAYGPSTNGNGCAMVMERFLRDLFRNKLNRMGKSKHPYVVVLKNSPS